MIRTFSLLPESRRKIMIFFFENFKKIFQNRTDVLPVKDRPYFQKNLSEFQKKRPIPAAD